MNHRPLTRRLNRRFALTSLGLSALGLTGCPLSLSESTAIDESNGTDAAERAFGEAAAEHEVLLNRIGRCLADEKRRRGLSTMVNGAWQIFHGILAYGERFPIDTPSGRRPALEYFRRGGTCDGFQPTLGDPLASDGRYGMKVALEPTTKVGQGHRDQWLAVVAQAGVPIDAKWKVGDHEFVIEDWLRQAELDVPLNYETEFSWTLIPLSFYRGTEHRFTGRDGDTYSTELLLESEVSRDLSASVCGGTHRLIGIAYALRNRIAEGKPLSGPWNDAASHLKAAIELTRVNQNPDGSYSTSYMHRTGWCNDLGEMLGTTGHVLEFLAIAADQTTLRSEWVRRSATKLCDILEWCRNVDLECGVLYHALHGLAEYERRLAAG